MTEILSARNFWIFALLCLALSVSMYFLGEHELSFVSGLLCFLCIWMGEIFRRIERKFFP